MKLQRALAALGAIVLIGAAALYGHVRLMNSSNGHPLFWANHTAIPITINATGSDNLPDGSHFTALRNAIDEWNGISDSNVRIVEDTNPGAQARTDWMSNSLHLVYFDETNSSGFFPSGSGIVAITPVSFFSSGQLADADILFNGRNFSFSTSLQFGRYDVQDVATHELGHVLGLDHSGWASASLYPFVTPAGILHRSLSDDERTGMRAIYPSAALGGITGTLRRASDNSPVRGAHVVARDVNGQPAGATITGVNGDFLVSGLAPGSYTLYATPLDFPVGASNLGAGLTIDTDFESTELGSVVLTGSETQTTGSTLVGADVSLSLGRSSDRFPLRCTEGLTTSITIRGSGLVNGSSLSASDPSITITPTAWFTSQVSARVDVPLGHSSGHVDVTVVNPAGDRSILVAALELTPPDPTVSLASPNQGDIAGGTDVNVFGTHFAAGARVVMGGEVYVDGAIGGCTVVNTTTISLTTRPGLNGVTDVVVIDSSGVEGRKTGGFQFISVPVLDTLYPSAGSALGGTEVRLRGQNFEAASVVRIAGVVQSSVLLASPQKLVVITEPGVVGGPYLVEVENPGGSISSAFFTYVSGGDPQVTSITPAFGLDSGGDVLRIDGRNFGANLRVSFGADPDTGLGGAPAASVVMTDSSTLEVTTPARPAGLAALVVEDLDTAQAAVVTSGFTFQKTGGGGGGCYTVPVQGPPDKGDILRSLLWFAMVAFGLRIVARGPGHRARERVRD